MILSHRRDTITQTWYYHTDVILCITQTWYFFLGLFFTYFGAGSRVALFKFWKFGLFWTSVCNFFVSFLKISMFLGPRHLVALSFWSITQTWYFVSLKYHVSVILKYVLDLVPRRGGVKKENNLTMITFFCSPNLPTVWFLETNIFKCLITRYLKPFESSDYMENSPYIFPFWY